MVRSTDSKNNAINATRTGSKPVSKSSVANKCRADRAERTETVDFEVDTDLLSDDCNQVRRPQLSYGIVVNDKPAEILIPIDQLEKAGWIAMPDDEDLTTVTFTEDVTGLLITEARLLKSALRKPKQRR